MAYSYSGRQRNQIPSKNDLECGYEHCDNSGAYWIKYLKCPLLYVGQTGGSSRHDTKTTFAFWWVIGITQIMHLIYWTQAIHHRQYIWNRPGYYDRIIYKCNGKSHIYRAVKNKEHLNESYTCIRCANTRWTLATVPSFNKTKWQQCLHTTTSLNTHLR